MALWQKGPQTVGTEVEWPAGVFWTVTKAIKNATAPPSKGAYYQPVAVAPAPPLALPLSASFNPVTRTADFGLRASDFEFAIVLNKA